MEYKTVWQYTIKELDMVVNEHLERGWELHGNQYIFMDKGEADVTDGGKSRWDIQFIQPMIKNDND
tara:strand:- start:790 stop:987 length:198 start_codon:yes stop_codon:yes gene_type:complete